MPCRSARSKALVLLSVTAPALAACVAGSRASGCDVRSITVAAAPAVFPAVRGAALRYNSAVSCARVTVTNQNPADVAGVLSGQGAAPGAVAPDAWIPDSSLWLPITRRTRAGATAVQPSGMPVAQSPLVLAAPKAKAVAGATGRMLLSSALPGTKANRSALQVRFLDPAAQASGLGALMLAHHASGQGKNGLATFAISLYSNLSATPPDDRAAYAQMLHGNGQVAVVLSEQSVWQHDHTDATHPVTAHYPADGTVALDFPYVSTTRTPARSRTVEDFRSMLAQSQTREALQSLGLRTPDGVAGAGFNPAYGVSARTPRTLAAPDPRSVGEILQMWQRTVLGARMLILLDVSPSMGDAVPQSEQTRMQSTAQAAIQGLRILSDNSQVSLWEFATRLNGLTDYRQIVPYRDLDARVAPSNQRDALVRSFQGAAPVPGRRTALYDSVLAAYREAVRGYQPDHNNVLVVLTDGKNYDPGRTIDEPGLLRELKRGVDPLRPVAIVPIAFGPDVDPAPLQQIAETTGGRAFVTLDPRQIQHVFLEMLIRLTCGQTCPMA